MNVATQRNIRHVSHEELHKFFESIGEPKFRAKQVWEWIGQKHARSIDEMTNLSKSLREKLNEAFTLPALTVDHT